jgi:hypothetical protein
LNLSAGSSICANAVVSYAGGTLTMAASATNYVFLDMTKSCAPGFTSGGAGFPATGVPIAVVTTSSSAITSVSDVRTWFAARPVVDAGGQTYNVKAYGAKGDGVTDDTASIQATFSAAAASGAGGTVLFPPGKYLVSSQIAVQISNLEVRGYGASLLCGVAANCMLLGDLVHSYDYFNITIVGLGFSPTASSAGYAVLEDNAMGSRMVDLKPINNGSYTFSRFIQLDNDQQFLIDKLNWEGANVLSCTSSACGAAVWGMQGGSYYAVGAITNSNLSMGCAGNGIYWGGGPLTVVNVVDQAYSEAAIITAPNQAGGSGGLNLVNDYIEAGSCTNPVGNVGKMGVLAAGLPVTNSGGGGVGGGVVPTFPQNGTTGSTFYQYWVVPKNSGGSLGSPLAIGYLSNGNATINSTNSVTVTWPAISDAASYDLLRQIAVNGNPAPYGTGNFAVATGLSAGTYCTSTLCTYTDTTSTLSSYTINPYSMGYIPFLTFWPGDLVLSPAGSGSTGYASYVGPTDQLIVDANGLNDTARSPGRIVETGGTNWWFGSPYPYSPLLETSLGYHSQSFGTFALLLPAPNAWQSGRKGSLNVGNATFEAAGPTDLITLANSDNSVWSVPGHRPPFLSGDSALSQDSTGNGGNIAIRVGSTLSFYQNTLPLGSKWSAQLASTGWAWSLPHFGLQTTNTGAPGTPTLTDCKSSTVWQANHAYAQYSCIYDGSNFEIALMPGTSGTATPSWASSAGNMVTDGWFNGPIIWQNAGPGTALSPNTTYYVKVAATTLAGKSPPSGEASITTANDSNLHILLASGTNLQGATGYQVCISTTSGSEAPVTAPFSGAYTGNAYQLPIVSASGSGSCGNSSDTTGYVSFPGMFIGGGTAINAMNLYSTASITPTSVGATSCSDQTFSLTGLTAADRISNITPPSALGNVSLNGYASAAGTVLLHFCNPSSSSVTPPAGVYSFLAVH